MWFNLEVNTFHRNITASYELEGTSTGCVYDVINDYEVVAEVKINKMEAPHSDDGDGFNINKRGMENWNLYVHVRELCVDRMCLFMYTLFVM